MASGISIDLTANTRDFVSGAGKATDALEKVQDSLDDLTKEAQRNKAGEELGEGIKTGAREGVSANEKLEASFKDIQQASKKASTSVEEDSKGGGTVLSRSFRNGAKEAGEGLSELKDSSKQNAIETAASFQGSADSIASGFQAVASEALAGFGPLGLAAGLALSTGIGAVLSLFSTASERAQALQAQVKSMTDDLIDNKSLVVSTGFLNDQIKAIIEDSGKLNDARQKASRIGITQQQSVRAEAGDTKSLTVALKAAEKAYQAKYKAALLIGSDQATKAEANSAAELVDHYKDLIAANKDAASSASFYASATTKLSQAQKDQAKQTKAAQQASKDAASDWSGAVQQDYADAGSNISDFVKGAKFDLDGYTNSVEQQAKDAVAFQANSATAIALLAKGGHDSAIAYLSKLGPDSAPLIAAFINAPAGKQADLEKVWDQLGGAASTSFGNTLKSNLNAQDIVAKVRLQSDTDAFLRDLASRTVTIPARLSSDGRVYAPGGKVTKY